MSRKEIKAKADKLAQLEKLENLIKNLEGEAKNHWWHICIPSQDAFSISEYETRDNFKLFIIKEILRLKIELGIED